MVSRAEHRRTTLANLSLATTEAFEQLGPAATIDDIAQRAGVSRRTVFRYVDTKEDLIYLQPSMWLDVFDDAIAEWEQSHDQDSVRGRILHAAHRISEHIDADPTPVRRTMMVALDLPEFARGYASVSQRWVARLATEILGDSTEDDAIFRSKVLGAAIMGVIDAALHDWVADPKVKLVDVIDRGLEYLAPILEDQG